MKKLKSILRWANWSRVQEHPSRFLDQELDDIDDIIDFDHCPYIDCYADNYY